MVLLDLDGTLTDSAPGIVACLRHALELMDRPVPEPADLRSHLGPPLSVTFAEHFAMSPPDVTRAIALYRDRYHDVGLFENAVYDGVPEMLTSLAADGGMLALATSKPTGSATRILEHFGLAEYFAAIAGADLIGRREAKADVITYALDLLDRPPGGAVMVGDRRHDVLGAASHGIPAVGVLWGYGDEAELRQAGAAAVATTPADVPELVRAAARPG